MLISIALAAAAYALVPLLLPMWQGLRKENYRGTLVCSGLGIAFILPVVPVLILRFSDQAHSAMFAAAILWFALLGLLDDLLGTSAKGFKGHFLPGRMSTGVLKAVGGAIAAAAISHLVSTDLWQLFLNTLLITLGANFLNLLDLGPGRAGKSFIFFSLVLLLFCAGTLMPLLWLTGAVLGYLPWDLKEEAMMGDAGANVLGAVLGLAAVFILSGLMKILVIGALIALHFLAEKVSFSKIIMNNRLLNFLDRLGR